MVEVEQSRAPWRRFFSFEGAGHLTSRPEGYTTDDEYSAVMTRLQVPSEILTALNCSLSSDLKPCRLGFEVHGQEYIYKQRGALSNHLAEYASLKHMYEAAPGFVPKPISAGEDPKTGRAFFCCEYINMGSCYGSSAQEALGKRLAELHMNNIKSGQIQKYGFDRSTYCGDTQMDNEWNDSWADFYANQRLRPIAQQVMDVRLQSQVENVCNKVVPLLCSSNQIKPSLLHGDLWSGNIGTRSGTSDPVIFDACSFYGHNEADLGISIMFGGFSDKFFNAYHEVIPRLEPHYDERLDLYRLYHELNHAAMFGGGGYSSSASRTCSKLLNWAAKQSKG